MLRGIASLNHALLYNDEAELHARGTLGITTWKDELGRRWLYEPMLGPSAKDAPKFQQS
jgi:hypothetical protein